MIIEEPEPIETILAGRAGRRRRMWWLAGAAVLAVTLGSFGYWLLRPQPRELARLRDHGAETYGLAYSHDGRWLATASRDRTVKIRDGDTGRPRVEFEHRFDNVLLAFTPDDRFLILGGWHGPIAVHDAKDGARVATLAGTSPALAIGVASNGKTVATVRLKGREEYEATTWDVSDWSERTRVSYPSWHQAFQLAISPDGKTLASVDQANGEKVGLMDLTTGLRLADIEPGYRYDYATVGTLAFSPDGRTLAIGRDRSAVEFWGIGGGSFRLSERISLPPDQVVRLIAMSEDHRAVAIGGFRYRPATSGPLPIPLGGSLASLGQNGPGVEHMVDIYTMPGRRLEARFDDTAGVPRVAFSRDGRRLVIANRDNSLTIWQRP